MFVLVSLQGPATYSDEPLIHTKRAHYGKHMSVHRPIYVMQWVWH